MEPGNQGDMDVGKPPKMPRAGVATELAEGGLMEASSPFAHDRSKDIGVVQIKDMDESGGEDLTPLKSALSTDVHGNRKVKEKADDDSSLKRNVSWADFHDAAALTTVVEFERDPAPSSPTSIDSWEGTSGPGCICCSVQ